MRTIENDVATDREFPVTGAYVVTCSPDRMVFSQLSEGPIQLRKIMVSLNSAPSSFRKTSNALDVRFGLAGESK